MLARTEASSWRAFSSTAAGNIRLYHVQHLVRPSVDHERGDKLGDAIRGCHCEPVAGEDHNGARRGAWFLPRCALLSGAANYLYTMSQYTARVQFADTFDRIHGIQYVSAMSYSPNMKYFYVACALGQGESGEAIMRLLGLQGSHHPRRQLFV